LVVADGKKKSLFCRIAVLSVLFPIGVLSDCTMVNRLLDARQRFRILLLLFLVFMLLLLPSFFNINLSFYHFVEMSREKRQVIYRFCFLINIYKAKRMRWLFNHGDWSWRDARMELKGELQKMGLEFTDETWMRFDW
jgi:hypothetical protein